MSQDNQSLILEKHYKKLYEEMKKENTARQETEDSLTQWVGELTVELDKFKKRDTKMKPKLLDYATQHFLCPSCNETISIDESETYNKIFNVFCKYCGQRLDWDKEK